MTRLKKSDQPVNADSQGIHLAASTKRSERSDQAFRYIRNHPALWPAAFTGG
jgi:L-lysine 2,3-aminomutase